MLTFCLLMKLLIAIKWSVNAPLDMPHPPVYATPLLHFCMYLH